MARSGGRPADSRTTNVRAFAGWRSLSRKDIFVTTAGETLTVWPIHDKGLLGRDLGHKAAATALAFSPDGQTLFSGDEVGTVKKWWNLTPKQSVRFSGKTEVSDVNADGDTVVAKIINDVIELNKIRLDLDGMKPVGLRLEDKATRLLVNDDSGASSLWT